MSAYRVTGSGRCHAPLSRPADVEWCVPCGRDHSAIGPCPESGDL